MKYFCVVFMGRCKGVWFIQTLFVFGGELKGGRVPPDMFVLGGGRVA